MTDTGTDGIIKDNDGIKINIKSAIVGENGLAVGTYISLGGGITIVY